MNDVADRNYMFILFENLRNVVNRPKYCWPCFNVCPRWNFKATNSA